MSRYEKLSATALKFIALAAMTLDHVQYFIGREIGLPFWVRIIGRIAIPIFLFLSAQGAEKTRNSLKYLARLYILNLLMMLLNAYACGGEVQNGFAGTLFLVVLLITLFRRIRECGQRESLKYELLVVAVVAVPIVAQMLASNTGIEPLVCAVLPSVFSVEGGAWFVALGAGFCFFPTKKGKLWYFTLFCAVYFAVTVFSTDSLSLNWRSLFEWNIQWMMILALPFLIMYNGQRGKGFKWLFYAYYPVHVYLLYFISTLLA